MVFSISKMVFQFQKWFFNFKNVFFNFKNGLSISKMVFLHEQQTQYWKLGNYKKIFEFYRESLDWRNTNTPKIWKTWKCHNVASWRVWELELHIILITCSSKCIQNFKAFWDGDVFGSVKWYGMPRLHIIIAISLLCSELLC